VGDGYSQGIKLSRDNYKTTKGQISIGHYLLDWF